MGRFAWAILTGTATSVYHESTASSGRRLPHPRYTRAMSDSRLVYSTDGQRHTDARDLPPKRPERPARPGRPAPRQSPAIPDDGVVRLFRERGGRGGKVVTVVRGLRERGTALDERAGELKRLCGAGGAVKDGAVEIQGDHRDRIAERLRTLGYTVKLAGG